MSEKLKDTINLKNILSVSVHTNAEVRLLEDFKRINGANLAGDFVLLHHHPGFTVDHTERVSTAGSNQTASSTSAC